MPPAKPPAPGKSIAIPREKLGFNPNGCSSKLKPAMPIPAPPADEKDDCLNRITTLIDTVPPARAALLDALGFDPARAVSTSAAYLGRLRATPRLRGTSPHA